ncbi:hypothetical protein IWQ60_010993, partial [Tieghemiomyces parasiticus]
MAKSALLVLLGRVIGAELSWLTLLSTALAVAVVSWVVYYAFLSPLARVPGPFICRILPAYLHPSLHNGSHYLWVTEMHRQYGPIVRIGHEAVTVTDRTSIREIYQNYTFIKASKWYRGIDQFAQGMFTTPHASVHKQRHRQMEPTFSRRSIHEMEGLILEFGSASLATTLARQCTAEAAVSGDAYDKAGVEVDMYTVLSHGTLDAITRLAFGRSV